MSVVRLKLYIPFFIYSIVVRRLGNYFQEAEKLVWHVYCDGRAILVVNWEITLRLHSNCSVFCSNFEGSFLDALGFSNYKFVWDFPTNGDIISAPCL